VRIKESGLLVGVFPLGDFQNFNRLRVLVDLKDDSEIVYSQSISVFAALHFFEVYALAELRKVLETCYVFNQMAASFLVKL
jgi:predicted SAM-dependent methyltransferase